MVTESLRALSCDSPDGLISIEQACSRAAAYASAIQEHEEVSLSHALGRTLALPVKSVLPLPPFHQSAMDGYALTAGDGLPSGATLAIAGRMAAGDEEQPLPQGNALRILTGARIPQGADAVVMQENVVSGSGRIVLTRMVRSGDNIRRCGEDVQAGEVLLQPGERIDARHVALLAAQGYERTCVRRRVRIGILSTGNELRSQGERLTEASFFDSNRPMIIALARQSGADVLDGGIVRDDPQLIAGALSDLARRCDLIVTTGGVSVGDEDHSMTALLAAGGRGETLRIALKPGKPGVVGAIERTTYLGLPGNPVAALVSWLLLGSAVLAILDGRQARPLSGMRLPLMHAFNRRLGRTEFAPARVVQTDRGTAVEILGRGGSARLKPLAAADGLVRIEPLHAPVAEGDELMFHPFRDGFSV
ncbi:molybdopterin molybdotransferase MoeA [Microvirga splendida]|uniref:Molybdopterin molybdenumtransferase n=1 Tax=Microvirga splendida TaxID=2795727 RepID=A0ABS0Y575_9HYPH|nr:gephyrin-like molybdotransferase Glp [Microvirga splendida]MBJ6127429.1 molybdopterin molybdotransferase MoeA [Microvirga splendida]